jgi:two-component system CheB/CheR fusion protein
MERTPLFVAGFASSAGGIAPLKAILSKAICHSHMAFVIVPHLSRDHESLFPEVLAPFSNLKIKVITDGIRIEPCHLYILPPKFYAVAKNHHLYLKPRPETGSNQAADVLFESLAESYGSNAIGVVLSGAAIGADGSKGISKIRALGGYTYAQKPETADFPEMPTLAIETGCIDSVLTPEEIGVELSMLCWASE